MCAHPDRWTPAPEATATVQELDLLGRGTLSERMGIRLHEASPDRVVGSMPVAGNTQPAGMLHGGASAVLAETLGSIAAMLHAGPGRVAVGIDVSAAHHAAVRAGRVTGIARPLHRGRTLACYEIAITDQAGDRVCTARLTCLLRDAAPHTRTGDQGEVAGQSGEGPASGQPAG